MEQVTWPFRLGAPNYHTNTATKIIYVYMHEHNDDIGTEADW
jgi:hypothetical protein